MTNINITDQQLNDWNKNRLINPVTKRKIKENGPIYKKIKTLYDLKINEDDNVDNYQHYRSNKIDPILLLDLPLNGKKENESHLFKFEYKWNPYTGTRSNEKDNCGPLYFDPNSLIHYFYTNRLNNLWIPETYNEYNEFVQGHYGDALGKFPDFEIVGRGLHPEWYLFRLPIIDCYLSKDHFSQSVTMGPYLTDSEIKQIYSLSKKYKSFYKETFGYNRPNLIKLKELYDRAVNPLNEYDYLFGDLSAIPNDEIQQIKFQINTDAVRSLISFR